jgi:WD40 repeat protein
MMLYFRNRIIPFLWASSCAALGLAQSPVYFEDAVAPVLRKNCIACHNAKLAEGGLNLESFAAMSKGGDSGPAIDAKQIDSSEILKRVVSTGDDVMPPKGNTVGAESLNSAQVASIRDWISKGALSKGTSAVMSSVGQLKLPETARASYAMAVSPNADFVAYGRGGQLIIQNALSMSAPGLADGALNTPADQTIADAHPDFIHSLAISSDGTRIASGSTGEVKIWRRKDFSAGARMTEMDVTEIPITQLFCVSTDGQWLSSVRKRAPMKDAAKEAAKDAPIAGVLTIMNRLGEIVQTIDVPDARLQCGAWSPDNQRLFAINSQGLLSVWDLSSVPAQPPMQIQVPMVVTGLVSLDRDTLLVLSERAVSVWKLQSGAALEKATDHPLSTAINKAGPVDLMAISHDRMWIAIGSQQDGQPKSDLRLWSVAQAKMVGAISKDRASNLEYARTDQIAARVQAAHERSKASVTELEKALQAEETAVKNAQTNKEKSSEAVTKKEQERVAAVQAMAEHEKAMTETQAAIEAATKKLEMLKAELETKKKALTDLEKQKADAQTAADNAVQSLASTEESQKAAAARLDAKKVVVAQLADEASKAQSRSQELKTAADSVQFNASALAFMNGHCLASLSQTDAKQTKRVDIFSLETFERLDSQPLSYPIRSQASLMALLAECKGRASWELERKLDSPRLIIDRVTALAFSADGTRLAIGSGLPSRNGQLAVVRTADGSPLRWEGQETNPDSDAIDLHSDTILNLGYSPDGRWLASCGADKMTKLLDATTHKVVKVFEGHTHHVLALAWQDTGHRIATASADATVKIWDIEKGEAVRTITGFGTEVTSLSFVGRSSNIVSSTMNNLVRLHDAESGKQNKQFGPVADSLYSVAVMPNGQYTLSAGQEGIVRIWKIDDGKLIGEWK